MNFLGLKASYKLDVRLEKTGVDQLREAIANYDELKSSLPQWASFLTIRRLARRRVQSKKRLFDEASGNRR